MAVDITLNTIVTGFNLAQLNENFTLIDAALQDAVSRSATTPNAMLADLDMNSKRLINLPDPIANGHAVNKAFGDANYGGASVQAAVDAAASAAAALVSENTASTAATNAGTSETNSGASETAAGTSATNALTSENAAAVSATASETSASAIGAKYTFDSSVVMGDPGTGTFRFDNAVVGSVTNLAFDATTADTSNPDISDFIVTWDDSTSTLNKGNIIFKKSSDPATFVVFSITGVVTDNTGWLQVGVTHVASQGTWTASDQAFIQFVRSGDSGSGVGDLIAGNNLSDVADAPTSLTNLGGIGPATVDTLTNKTFDANGTGNSLTNVDVADLAVGTDGELITWDAVGAPATVPVGLVGDVLTSGGVGATPTFQPAGGGLESVQVFTASGTWTKPAGITKIRVQLVGGGSGAATALINENGPGGGGGGYSEKFIASPSASETVTVGPGGAGGVGTGNSIAGGTSSFGALLSATGGDLGGHRGNGASGGAGTGGDINSAGGGGGSFSVAGATGQVGGASRLGGGGRGTISAITGAPGRAFGGGGGGAAGAQTGGAGADGVVIVWEYK